MKPLSGSNPTENPSPSFSALHAERSGRSLGREAGRRVVAAQYELVGGDLVERVEQSQPLAQLVTHREQELAAEVPELLGLVAQRHGGGGLRGASRCSTAPLSTGCPSAVISQRSR